MRCDVMYPRCSSDTSKSCMNLPSVSQVLMPSWANVIRPVATASAWSLLTSLPTQGIMNSIDQRGWMDWIIYIKHFILEYFLFSLPFSFILFLCIDIYPWMKFSCGVNSPNYLSHKQMCLWLHIRSRRFCELLPGHCCEIGARAFVVSGTKRLESWWMPLKA